MRFLRSSKRWRPASAYLTLSLWMRLGVGYAPKMVRRVSAPQQVRSEARYWLRAMPLTCSTSTLESDTGEGSRKAQDGPFTLQLPDPVDLQLIYRASRRVMVIRTK